MDWLIKPVTLSLIASLFTLAVFRKRKENNDDDESSTAELNAEELAVVDETSNDNRQRSHAEIEKESQEIIKRELSLDASSYETIRSYRNPFTGFLHYYLHKTKIDKTLTTTAKFEIVEALSKNDLLLD